MHSTWRHLFCTKILIDSDHHKWLPWHKVHEKDVVGIAAFDLIGLLPTNHIIAYITIANSTIAKTTQNIWNFIVRKSNLQEIWHTSAIIQEISDSNMETGRNSSKSGFFRIIQESWHPCITATQTPPVTFPHYLLPNYWNWIIKENNFYHSV